MKKVIYDTDIGIDDAMALLFLHYSPEVELQAIITGFGNASIENTTRNALFMKEYFAIAAPIYRGAAHSVSVQPGEEHESEYPDFVHGKNGLGDIDIPHTELLAESLSGAEAIVKHVSDNPGEISIVAVGRMTNLALALQLCPELPALVKELIVMGGAFGFNDHKGNVTDVAEANIWGDALAANQVFNAGFALTIVGLDVTQETIANTDFFDHLSSNAGKAGRFIYDISRYYLNFHLETQGKYECPVHDSSAVAYLLRPDFYTTRVVSVKVLQDKPVQGQTIYYDFDPEQAKAPCSICTAVRAQDVLALYTATLISG